MQELLEKSQYRNANNPSYHGTDPDGHAGVRLHMFEHTTRFHKDENYDYYYPPLQCVLAIKEANAGKLDSHLWFFSAFCDSLNPTFCGVSQAV